MMVSYEIDRIRNFSIIAHIDHGKSTLADRLLELTNTFSPHEMREQVLDKMDLERERGITIKAHPVTMTYTLEDTQYQLNLIDTPGHVDFTYEVNRALSACEGTLLVIDASQGIQAQTIANAQLAIDNSLEIIPVINKIDLPSASVPLVTEQIKNFLNKETTPIAISAKSGINIQNLLEEIIYSLPPPNISSSSHLRALVFDSHYDAYRGVIVYLRIFDGTIKKGDIVRFLSSNKPLEVLEVGIFSPNMTKKDSLSPGLVGYMVSNIKNPKDVLVGDTIVNGKDTSTLPLPGFKKITPLVFAGIFPIDSKDFILLGESLEKLALNDSSLEIDKESSQVLGCGFRCGFLGLLHLEVILERLSNEFNIEVITTSPSVAYKIFLQSKEELIIDNPLDLPDPSKISYIEEPWVSCDIISPTEHIGAILSLIIGKRGELVGETYIGESNRQLKAEIPLGEVITNFNEKIKSYSRGYASFNYTPIGYKKGQIVKLNILVNEELVEAFSTFTHKDKAISKGREICKKLLTLIPKQQFKIPIQAAIGGKIISRETIPAITKHVTEKCYGGDITRKRKLWDRQKKGKMLMKSFGKVPIPKKAFLEILKSN